MGARAVIDITDGHQRRRFEVHSWPVRIGRALDNELILDDDHVAPWHATLDDVDGRIVVTPAATRNGARLGPARLTPARASDWPEGARLQLGKVTLRLRHAAEALAPEVALAHPRGGVTTGLLAIALLAWLAGEGWLDLAGLTPVWQALLPPLLLVTLVLAVWVGGWALINKLFSRHAELGRHAVVALGGSLGYLIADTARGALAFAFDWPLLDRYASLLAFAALALVVAGHLRVVSPARPLLRTLAVSLPTLAAIGVMMLMRLDTQGSPADQHTLTTLYPPFLRVAPAQPLDAFLARTGELKATLDAEAADPAEDGRDYPL